MIGTFQMGSMGAIRLEGHGHGHREVGSKGEGESEIVFWRIMITHAQSLHDPGPQDESKDTGFVPSHRGNASDGNLPLTKEKGKKKKN